MVTSLRHAQEVPTQERFLTPRRNAHRPSQATMQTLGDCCRCGTDAGFTTNGLPSIIAPTTHTHTHKLGAGCDDDQPSGEQRPAPARAAMP